MNLGRKSKDQKISDKLNFFIKNAILVRQRNDNFCFLYGIMVWLLVSLSSFSIRVEDIEDRNWKIDLVLGKSSSKSPKYFYFIRRSR